MDLGSWGILIVNLYNYENQKYDMLFIDACLHWILSFGSW